MYPPYLGKSLIPLLSLKTQVDTLKQELENLHNEAEDLKRQVYRLQLEKDVLEKAAEILKKDQGVSLEKLTNREKAVVIGALRRKI